MRVDFVSAVEDVLAEDARSVFVTGDLGFRALEHLASRFGRRFLNAGVAEQNMVGAAAGMAMTGLRPWVYSIAPFVTYRCLEQIRNDVCLHRLPVRIVGNGGGYTYGIMGSTHHALEDLAVLRPLPNMQLFFPCSNDHVRVAVRAISALEGPSYLRLSISGYATDATVLSESSTTLTRRYAAKRDALPAATVVGVGHGVQIVLRALGKQGLGSFNVDVFGVARFPWDFSADRELAASVATTGRVLVVEEHYRNGGMGESLQAALPAVRDFRILSAIYSPEQRYGSPLFHLQQSDLTPEAVTRSVRELLEGRR